MKEGLLQSRHSRFVTLLTEFLALTRRGKQVQGQCELLIIPPNNTANFGETIIERSVVNIIVKALAVMCTLIGGKKSVAGMRISEGSVLIA